MYIPNYDKLTSIAEEQGQYYKGVQDDYDAITNAAKTASAQVKYIQDPRVKDAEEYKRWLGNLQTQQNEIAKAYQQDYRLGMQKLKEFQQGLHQDLTAGEGNYLNSRYNRYTKEMQDLEESGKKGGLYEGSPEYVNYFTTGKGSSWLGDYDYKSGSGDLNIKTPVLQGHFDKDDWENLRKSITELDASEEDLLTAAQGDPKMVALIQDAKAKFLNVNGRIPFHKLVVSGSLKGVSEDRIMQFLMAQLAPRYDDLNFTYKVQGLDYDVTDPKTMFTDIPEIDSATGNPKIGEDGKPISRKVVNTNNPLMATIKSMAEASATQDPTFKYDYIKDEMASEMWKYSWNRAKEIEDYKAANPITTSEVVVRNAEEPALTRTEIADNINHIAKSMGVNPNTGDVLAQLNGKLTTTLAQLKQSPGNKELISTVRGLQEAKTNLQNQYALISQAEKASNIPSYQEFVATVSKPKKYEEQEHLVRGSRIVVKNGVYNIKQDDGKLLPLSPSVQSHKGIIDEYEQNKVRYKDTYERKANEDYQRKLQEKQAEYHRRVNEGFQKLKITHTPTATFTNATPLESVGIQLTPEQVKFYNESVAGTLEQHINAHRDGLYAVKMHGDGTELTPQVIPSNASNIRIVRNAPLQYSNNGFLDMRGQSTQLISATVEYDVPVAEGKFNKVTQPIAIPQSVVSKSGKTAMVDINNPSYGFSFSELNDLPEAKAANAVKTAQSYTGNFAMEIAKSHDPNGPAVYKKGDNFIRFDGGKEEIISAEQAIEDAVVINKYNDNYQYLGNTQGTVTKK